MRQLAYSLVFLLVSFPALADQFPQARDLLQRLSVAMNELNYQGTFVYVRGEDVETMRITHVNDNGQVRERMYAMSGPQREIIRDEKGVRCVLGENEPFQQNSLLTGSIFPEFPVEALKQARKHYIFEAGKTERIAGHKARRVNVFPKDQFRYGYDLWLDEETGLLLRWVLYDANRKSLAKLMFTELKTGASIDRSELESTTPEERFIALEEAEHEPRRAGKREHKKWSSDVPAGFRLAAHSFEGKNDELEHIVLSDGLATVSVYIEPAEEKRKVTQGLSRMGTTNAWSRISDSRQVTAIGEVPPVTVKKIGKAFSATNQ